MVHPQYPTRREAAEYLAQRYGSFAISMGHLAQLAHIGGGPLFHKIGKKRVAYTVEALDAWMADRISLPARSTSEAA